MLERDTLVKCKDRRHIPSISSSLLSGVDFYVGMEKPLQSLRRRDICSPILFVHPQPTKNVPLFNSSKRRHRLHYLQQLIMSDVRHSVSDPRPVGGDENLPSWEVDILRDDTVIVDTFLLNNEVLPPRTNKKGKVVWRLPDTADKLVSAILHLVELL